MICRHCRVKIHPIPNGLIDRWGDGTWIICSTLGFDRYHEPDVTDDEAIAGLQEIVGDL